MRYRTDQALAAWCPPTNARLLVLVQVSSMKTRCRTSSVGFSAFQLSRAAAMSGRACSAATRDFFERQLEPPQRVPHRADADRDGEFLEDPRPQPIQRHIGLSGHLRRNRLIVLRKLRLDKKVLTLAPAQRTDVCRSRCGAVSRGRE
jgi:hypothetical protein